MAEKRRRKQKRLEIRISEEELEEFKNKSEPYGGMSRVMRALIRFFNKEGQLPELGEGGEPLKKLPPGE